MRQLCLAFVILTGLSGANLIAQEAKVGEKFTLESLRVFPEGEGSPDARLGKLRTLRDAYHPWTPPETKAEWEQEAKQIRTQLLVSNGLWPMWPKSPFSPRIHGEIVRDDYIVKRVSFESLPGHYVSGNLYLPKKIEGKIPGILCPHGHWTDARFYDAGEENAKKLIADGSEKFVSAARNHLQARMVQLARMGCAVFHYDMVGSADSKQIPHASGFTDVEAGLWLQNAMGLQTWNSIRALDFLTMLPEVDHDRLGMTGASGGGTQTFILAAIDPRLDVVFPAVMVSTAMQGGCICENADYLRLGLNNVALAALFAPKPMAMSGANDWTIDIETKGYPELQQVYSFYGEKDKVYAECHPEFGHNYNAVSRKIMYGWMKQHLGLDESVSIEERDFELIPAAELSVYTEEHPLPGNATDASGVRKELSRMMKHQYEDLLPQDEQGMVAYRKVVEPAARVMLGGELPKHEQVSGRTDSTKTELDDLVISTLTIAHLDGLDAVPVLFVETKKLAERSGDNLGIKPIILWLAESGKQSLFNEDGTIRPEIRTLLNADYAVASLDLFLTGEAVTSEWANGRPVDEKYSGYTLGYNRPVLAERVRDVLAMITILDPEPPAEWILVGTGEMGIVALLASGLAEDRVSQTIVNLNGFSFSKIESIQDPFYLPGAMRYGGVGGLGGLAAPHNLTVAGWKDVAKEEKQGLESCYKATQGNLQLLDNDLTRKQIVELILKGK